MTAYLLTMNPASLTDEDPTTLTSLENQAERFRDGDLLEESFWSTRTKSHEAGARVYLLRQGREPRGIFASGHLITGEIQVLDSYRGDGKQLPYVLVEWDVVLDRDEPLPLAALQAAAPSTRWTPRQSGTRIRPADEVAVEDAWTQFLESQSAGTKMPKVPRGNRGATDPGGWDPSYTEALKKVRKHQAKFRRLLLEHHPVECAYCGLDILEVIEAAHLIPDSKGGAASVENGRLLCANHHKAFDAGLLRWTGKRFTPAKGAGVIPPEPRT